MNLVEGHIRAKGAWGFWALCLLVFSLPVRAESTRYVPEGYDAAELFREVRAVPVESGALIGGTLAIGFLDWKWGEARFHFVNEGFFGKGTRAMGMDKLGHVQGTTLIADVMTDGLTREGYAPATAALTGAIVGMGVMTLVEVFDGFSDYGFSREDLVADAVGASFAFVRNAVPGLREKLDYRMEYVPSGNAPGFKLYSDYSGQKYVFALKGSGFASLQNSPLRFFELQAGYFARGFTLAERELNQSVSRNLYVGIGLNLESVLLGLRGPGEGRFRSLARGALQHFQLPYTYATPNRRAYQY